VWYSLFGTVIPHKQTKKRSSSDHHLFSIDTLRLATTALCSLLETRKPRLPPFFLRPFSLALIFPSSYLFSIDTLRFSRPSSSYLFTLRFLRPFVLLSLCGLPEVEISSLPTVFPACCSRRRTVSLVFDTLRSVVCVVVLVHSFRFVYFINQPHDSHILSFSA
jgi:hypothetical protein